MKGCTIKNQPCHDDQNHDEQGQGVNILHVFWRIENRMEKKKPNFRDIRREVELTQEVGTPERPFSSFLSKGNVDEILRGFNVDEVLRGFTPTRMVCT